MMARPPGHDSKPTGRRTCEDMAVASFTAKSLVPLAVISSALLLGGLL
jgi:hypothetical protein